MKNKLLVAAIAVLAGVLIFENAYLLGRNDQRKDRHLDHLASRKAPVRLSMQNRLPVVYENSAWDPFTQMNRIQERMNRVFDENFSRLPDLTDVSSSQSLLGASTSFVNNDSAYVVKISMPGINKNNINFKIKDRRLIISGENKKNKTDKGDDYYSQESSYGNFLSSFILPQDAQTNKITSDYKDGVFTITIPKQAQKK